MTKTKHKILSVFLSLCMIITCMTGLSVTSSAADITTWAELQAALSAGGTVTLTLQFGLADAPDAATATLTSTHAYEDTILLVLPYQREARFVDSFTLAKAE